MHELFRSQNKLPEGTTPPEPHPQPEIFNRGTITFKEFFGGVLPAINFRKVHDAHLEFGRLSELPFNIRYIQYPDGTEEFIFTAESPINGKDLNYLMYMAAPDREIFGLDIGDIIGDWRELYDGTEVQKKRLERHRRIPGWGIYENERLALLHSLGSGVEANSYIVPYLSWRKKADGTREWVFTTPDNGGNDNPKKNSVVGLVYLYAYLPEITNQLAREMGHNPRNNFAGSGNRDDDYNQTQGATQVIPHLVFTTQPDFRRYFPDKKTLFDSHLVLQMKDSIRTGQVNVRSNFTPRRSGEGSEIPDPALAKVGEHLILSVQQHLQMDVLGPLQIVIKISHTRLFQQIILPGEAPERIFTHFGLEPKIALPELSGDDVGNTAALLAFIYQVFPYNLPQFDVHTVVKYLKQYPQAYVIFLDYLSQVQA